MLYLALLLLYFNFYFEGFELCYELSRFHGHVTLCIAVLGTSDQSCWLAEACKSPSLDGLWVYGVTVS